jgi:hypothetical protein
MQGTRILQAIILVFIFGSLVKFVTGGLDRVKSAPIESSNPSEHSESHVEVNPTFDRAAELYQELLEFKGNPDFVKYGFGMGGPFANWLPGVQSLKSESKNKNKGDILQVAGDIEQLGLQYMTSKGEENVTTAYLHKVIKETITSAGKNNDIKHKVERTTTKTSPTEKGSKHLVGRWKISTPLASLNYTYEIYITGDQYLGIIKGGQDATEILTKRGNDYYIKGNRFGEYYRIDSDGNMKLFDRDGDLTSSGYRATKI